MPLVGRFLPRGVAASVTPFSPFQGFRAGAGLLQHAAGHGAAQVPDLLPTARGGAEDREADGGGCCLLAVQSAAGQG